MRKQFLLYIFIGLSLAGFSQELMDRDSLLRLLPAAKEDSNKVYLYIHLGQQYEGNDLDLSKYYYQKARDLSKKLGFSMGLVKFYMNYTFVLNQLGFFDSSLAMNLESVRLARQLDDKLTLGKTLFNTGSSYRLKEEYEQAVKYYEEGRVLMEPYNNPAINAQACDILQNLYTGMKQYRRALEYGRQAVQGLGKTGNLTMLGTAYNNLGLNYTNLRMFDSANYCFNRSLSIARDIGDQNMEATQYLNLGDILIQQERIADIKPLMEKALRLTKKLQINESQVIALKGLAFYYQYTQQYQLSKSYADSALALANKFDFRDQRQRLYVHMSNLAYSMQDMKLGEYYARLSNELEDSILNDKVRKTTLELEKKYETERQRNRISRLEADKKIQEFIISRKNLWNYILAAGALVLILTGFLIHRNYRHTRQLQQKRILELEAEKQLAATEAVLRGEEQERSRLAKDLHDGLGGMLSGIKYSFQTMRGNLVMTPENQQAFERSMDMLDSSIKEMRRVAHNMMPEALVKFGLDTSLRDFCDDVKRSGALDISYQSFGLENIVIPQQLAITIYRVVQELLNNTIKHAAATEALVQLSKSGDSIIITVEDNGKGFDTAVLRQATGIGWSNIRSRVEYLKGKLDVQSAPDKGTSVNIEFFI